MICGAIGFTFWRCSVFLVSIVMIQIWVAGAASVSDKSQCFRCDEISPCLEQQYVCNSVPDCANGRDEQTTKGGGCSTEDEGLEDKYMLPVIYVTVGIIVLEIIGVFAIVMYILNVRCCKLACNLKSKEKRRPTRSTQQSGPVKRSHKHHGGWGHYYIKPRRAQALRPLPQIPIVGVDRGKPFHIPEPVFDPIVPQTVDAERQGQYYDNNTRLWPQSNQSFMKSSPEQPFCNSVWTDPVPLTMPTVTRMSTDENKDQPHLETNRRTKPEPHTIVNASSNDRGIVRSEPRRVVHHHHTTIKHLTVVVPTQTEMAGRMIEAATRATLSEITDDRPGTSDGRTASASDKQIVPLHRPRKGTNMYNIDNLC
ncbi:uncharacterized protein LOC119739158 [Patiria miniata]|uniref:Uncharacterized protein n=1 Tax=Patiria miniata TaxID=46514 RepID=A0A914B1P2_PATMI|nr:uncharacterized protein LOC119739158 [Patiria miniata]